MNTPLTDEQLAEWDTYPDQPDLPHTRLIQEVRRLREAKSEPGYCGYHLQLEEEVDRLRKDRDICYESGRAWKAERGRYRQALETIADPKFWFPSALLDAEAVAREALNHPPKLKITNHPPGAEGLK